MPKEPTRQQLSSKLAYQANVPVFLQRLQRKIKGEDDDGEDEFDEGGSGRPPIPRRPAIPERPEGDAGSADEDDGDDGPQVVVLKAGKHLTEHEAENEKRKAKGLSPLSAPGSAEPTDEPNRCALSVLLNLSVRQHTVNKKEESW
ncbi:hypothetical protein EW026_g5979 [Hermanssonia centrifuga]|uniref:DUF4604 domain-containing protein n=1 Tax=Hermanssonia centrifuga TaxID=98765 RepID=A0A4S4KCI0_9APHY|nr:hypothetical protein EW026_g5979 [Hermanssonia centrifuga]